MFINFHCYFYTFIFMILPFKILMVSVVPRPIYNIAHMVNSIKEINLYLKRGANTIEADVSFSLNGTALYTFHGYPCDCFRHCTQQENIEKYLVYVREITKPENANYKKQLVLLFLDLKISSLPASVKANAGRNLARKVITNLFEFGTTTSKIKLLLSIGHVEDSDFVLGFQKELEKSEMKHLKDKIGWDVGMNDEVSDVISMWKKIKIIDNIWLGDGYSNCISPFYNLGRLTEVVSNRDLRSKRIPKDPMIDKVYHWTIDFHHKIRASLKLGVDGIITNHPERLYAILKERDFKYKYRLATHDDDPWKRIQPDLEEKPAPSATSDIQPVILTAITSASDMFTSFTKYVENGFFHYYR
ncbi:phospholipase D StSicTox-betaIC1-like isoform X2 [Tetranychus urticae]|uniref:phospholipase D StSicTox-betaIC1-like isoform X2 n=1 Tax=Tetranychus urticae TaxID=32264 RepID=UPI00077BF896|nr:phospholipase D StSicTox-betaIC1-like isoform X2 [Tetranychus urticae]